ncbi:unnamed protein product [Closterium sp. NIES-54]
MQRHLLLAAMLLAALFAGSASAAPRLVGQKPAIPAVVGVGADIVVAKDGSGGYSTVKDAIAAARSGTASRYFIIFIKAGVYNEQAVLPASLRFIGLVGENGTKITASNYSGQSNLNACATFQLLASDMVVSNIIFENAHGPGVPGGYGDQAVAVKAAGTRVAFYGCTFLGYQDTLYAVSGLQYYKNCVIQGRVDFVFGNAKALFHNCQFNLVYWGGGYFAQSREKGDDTGYVILGGSLSPLGPGPIKPGYLARSWGKYSTTIFVNTYFAAGSVRPEGWGYVAGNKKLRRVTFAVSGCYGPGWITDPNVLVRGVGGKVNDGGDGAIVPAGNATSSLPKPTSPPSSSLPKPSPPPPAPTSKDDKKSKKRDKKHKDD